MFDARQLLAVLPASHCYSVVLSRCCRITRSPLSPKVRVGDFSLDPYRLITRCRARDPCIPAIHETVGETTGRDDDLISVGEWPIALERNATRGCIFPSLDSRESCCPRFFAGRRATSGKRWSIRDKTFLSSLSSSFFSVSSLFFSFLRVHLAPLESVFPLLF